MSILKPCPEGSTMSTVGNRKPGQKHRIGFPQWADGSKTEDHIKKWRKNKVSFILVETYAKTNLSASLLQQSKRHVRWTVQLPINPKQSPRLSHSPSRAKPPLPQKATILRQKYEENYFPNNDLRVYHERACLCLCMHVHFVGRGRDRKRVIAWLVIPIFCGMLIQYGGASSALCHLSLSSCLNTNKHM